MKKLIGLFSLVISLKSYSYEIQDYSYDASTDSLTMTIIYDGTAENYKTRHKFKIVYGACYKNENPTGVEARLIDSTGWNDTGTDLITDVRSFSMAKMPCRPAILNLRHAGYGGAPLLSIYIP